MINELLDDQRYDIEFNGHLTNHVKHAVIALAGLGVPDERIALVLPPLCRHDALRHGVGTAKKSQVSD